MAISEQTDLLGQQERLENGLRDELLRLLRAARADVRQRIRELPPGASVGTLRQLEASLLEATTRLQGGMWQALSRGSGEAVMLGIRVIEAGFRGQAAVPFRLSDALLQTLAVYQSDLVRDVTDELRAGIRKSVQLGLLAGKRTEEIAREIAGQGLEKGAFPTAEARAETIAITELGRVHSMSGYARIQDAAQSVPGLRKRWISARDERVRDSHRRLNGKTIPVSEDFSVGGHPAKHPHDPRLPAAEAVRCRCRLLSIAPEE